MKFKDDTNWIEHTLQEISSKIGDGLHGTPKYSPDGEWFFINGNNLNGKITFKEKTKRIDKFQYEKLKIEMDEKTILLSINGTLGKIALYHGELVALGKSACYINLRDTVSRRFIQYILLNADFQNYLETQATGTTIKNASLKLIRSYSFILPPLDEQKRIAHVLGILDDKIELNRKMNKTLEAMAQALFKSWFVDFDPVIDNAIRAGNPIPKDLAEKAERRRKVMARESYKISKYADIFPDSFVDSELGSIPKGWGVYPLKLLSTKIGDGLHGTPNYDSDGKYHFINGNNLNGKIEFKPTTKRVNDSQFEKYKKDLHEETILLSINGTLGNVAYYNFEKVVLGKSACYINVSPKLGRRFVRQILLGSTFQHYLTSRATGTTIKNASLKLVRSYEFVCPNLESERVLEIFNKHIHKWEEGIRIFQDELPLKEVRDILLPKLVSGEIRVPK